MAAAAAAVASDPDGIARTLFSFCAPDTVIGQWLLLAYFIPFIFGLLFLTMSHNYRLHTVVPILLNGAFTLNSMLNSLLRSHLVRLPRPLPGRCGEGYGMPARQPQQLFFFITIAVIFAYSWHDGVRPVEMLFLTFTAVTSSFAYVYLRYYSVAQIVAGAVVGSVFASVCAVVMRLAIMPHLGAIVLRWNRHTPAWAQLISVYHFHPGQNCSAGPTRCHSGRSGQCCFVAPRIDELAGQHGFDILACAHVILELAFYTLIHRHA
jgi:hypothetical protein